MTQVASYQVPAHPSGLDMRTQLNAIVLAILGDNAGPAAPAVTYPGMMWGDTTAQRLKRRTNANDGWVDIGPIDNFLGDVTNQINNAVSTKVSKTGDTMTGQLIVQANIQSTTALYSGSSMHGTDGNIYGTCYGPSGDWLTNWVGNNFARQYGYGGITSLDGGFYTYRGSDTNGYGAGLSPGGLELWTYDTGCYIDFKQVNSQDYVWRLQMDQNGAGMKLYQSGGISYAFDGTSDFNCSSYGWVWRNGILPLRDDIGNTVRRNTGNAMYMGWGLRSSCVTVNVDNAWNRSVILSGDDRWYSMCTYDSRGFIAISIDGDAGVSGNRGIETQPSDGRLKNILGETKVDALDAILHIPIIRFAFREGESEYNDGEVHECGFDAHQAKDVAPGMVYEVGEAKIAHVYKHAGFAYCFRAIQQLFAILTDIRNELAELKAIIKGQAGESQS